MKTIAFAFLAAMAVLSFTGCKKKNDIGAAMAKMEGFKNDMCKCKAGEKACAEKVEKDMKAYTDSMKGKEPDAKSLSEADKKKMMDVMGEMGKCQSAAMAAGDMAPPATPPAGGDQAAPPAGGAAPPAPAGDQAAPPAGGAAPPAGDMKKEEPKK